jgi:hypothetical protein
LRHPIHSCVEFLFFYRRSSAFIGVKPGLLT